MPRKIGSARPDKQDVLSDVLAVKHTLLEVKYGGGEGRGPEGGGVSSELRLPLSCSRKFSISSRCIYCVDWWNA